MSSESKKTDSFKGLRWSDIQDWAGGKATSKGIKYQEEERVKEVKCTPEGSLVARVQGTTDYFTEISLENGKLNSVCTCPVGHDCKHGVAAVLEYLERVEQGEEIPVIAEEDPLVIRARRGYTGAKIFGIYDAQKSSLWNLRGYLEQLEKPELIDILVEFAEKDSSLGLYLRDRQSLAAENPARVVGEIYSEMDELWREARDYDNWNYEGEDMPEFSDLQIRMESLLDSGHPEELLEIGKELMNRYDGIAEYDEEGEIGTKTSRCMDVVFKALSQSSLPAHEKMLYALEIELKDNYNILDEHSLWKEDFSQEEWKLFSKALKVRLQEAEREENDLYYSSWERDYVIDRLVDALKKAGLSEEIIPVCELEAEISGSYVRLVRVLLDSGEKQRAEEWIYRGTKETREEKPGTASQLRQILLEIKESEGNWLFVTALETEEFFRYPQLASYIKMREAAKKIGKWQEIREAALGYLRSGELEAKQVSPAEETSILPGILPNTGLLEIGSLEEIEPPDSDLLIEIAIKENDPEEVIYWYEKLKEKKGEAEIYRNSAFENEVANAVKDKYPEIAIEIWKKLAESLIFETKVSSYEAASAYLRKIKELLEASGKKKEWELYLKNTRELNRRKRKLLEILDRLGKDRIIMESRK
jgi:uncharacterized Zn finger protein